MVEEQQPKKQTSRLDDVMAAWNKFLGKQLNPPSVVPVIRVSGIISAMENRNSVSLQKLNSTIEKAFNTPRTLAVALVINSPGGSPAQSSLIFSRIRSLSEEKDIPVLTFVEDVAASGGYWIACAGDEIFAVETSIVGSIGVISAGFGFVDAIEKLGIERRVHTEGKNKSILDPFQPEKPEDVKILKVLQKDIHKEFKDLVKSRRGEKLKEEDDKLMNGEFWTGKKAKKFGLIDEIGNMHDVIKQRFGDEAELKYFTRPKGRLERLLGVFFSQRNMVDDAASSIEEKSLWSRYGL